MFLLVNRFVLLAGIAGALLSLDGPVRANGTDDEIRRLVAQAQDQAAHHATAEVGKTIDEAARLMPRAGPEGVAAMVKLMEDLDHMTLDAGHEPAEAVAAPEVAVAPPPLPQARPASALASAGLLDLLRRRGDAAFQASDISGARRYYQRGAEAGCGPCAEALSRTYDAKELRRIGVIGIVPDPALAQTWRDRARQLGRTSTPQ